MLRQKKKKKVEYGSTLSKFLCCLKVAATLSELEYLLVNVWICCCMPPLVSSPKFDGLDDLPSIRYKHLHASSICNNFVQAGTESPNYTAALVFLV